MKKIIIFGILSLALSCIDVQAQCNDQLIGICADGIDGTYMRDFKVRMKKAKKKQLPPTARFTVVLNKGNRYRFSLCNAKELPGKSVVQIFDNQSLVGSSYSLKTGKDYPVFDFLCRKTGVYNIFISFRDGQEGCSVAMLFLVN